MAVEKKYECRQIDYGLTFQPKDNVPYETGDAIADLAGEIGTSLGFDNQVHSTGGSGHAGMYDEFDVEFNPAVVSVDQLFEELAAVKEAVAEKINVPFEEKAWLWISYIGGDPYDSTEMADFDPDTGKFIFDDGSEVDIREVDFIDYEDPRRS